MDTDLVVSDLMEVLERRSGRWPATLRSAPRLLDLPRYRLAGDPTVTLATDITAAIARLPEAVQHDANMLLNIRPKRLKRERWEAIGAQSYSGDAKKWRAIAVFTRVAVELLELWSGSNNQSSYKILDANLRVVVASTLGLNGKCERFRFHFSWRIEPMVPDLTSFSFSHRVRAWFKKVTVATANQRKCRAATHDREHDEDHWYGLFLHESLPVGVPAEVAADVEYMTSDRGTTRETSYVPPMSLNTLSLALQSPYGRYRKYRCVERIGPAAEIIREFDAISIDRDGTSHYQIPSPRTDCRYALEWP